VITCVLCRFEVQLDDVWLPFVARPARCICVRCFVRVTGIRHPHRPHPAGDALAMADEVLKTAGAAR